MARDHARLKHAILNDPDYRALPNLCKLLYLHILMQPRLSFAGVLDWIPERFADLGSKDEIETAAQHLAATRFVVIDHETRELLVRSFVRHDGLLDSPNVGLAMVRDLERTLSVTLRSVVLDELRRAKIEDPEAKAWAKISDPLETLRGTLPERVPETLPVTLPPGVSEPRGTLPGTLPPAPQNPSGNPSGKGYRTPAPTPSPTPSPSPAPDAATSSAPDAPPVTIEVRMVMDKSGLPADQAQAVVDHINRTSEPSSLRRYIAAIPGNRLQTIAADIAAGANPDPFAFNKITLPPDLPHEHYLPYMELAKQAWNQGLRPNEPGWDEAVHLDYEAAS